MEMVDEHILVFQSVFDRPLALLPLDPLIEVDFFLLQLFLQLLMTQVVIYSRLDFHLFHFRSHSVQTPLTLNFPHHLLHIVTRVISRDVILDPTHVSQYLLIVRFQLLVVEVHVDHHHHLISMFEEVRKYPHESIVPVLIYSFAFEVVEAACKGLDVRVKI